MPYTAEHKARTRERIVANARVMFNRRGFERVSIDEVMKESGLTRGGFYNHFGSKEELYAEAINSFAACNPFALETARRGGWSSPKQAARRLAELYLSDAVLDDDQQHCPLIALPSDAARSGREPRSAYTLIVRRMMQIFRAAFAGSCSEAVANERAGVMISLCVGSMVIARTTEDPVLRRSLRAAALRQAMQLLDEATVTDRRQRPPKSQRAANRGGRR